MLKYSHLNVRGHGDIFTVIFVSGIQNQPITEELRLQPRLGQIIGEIRVTVRKFKICFETRTTSVKGNRREA